MTDLDNIKTCPGCGVVLDLSRIRNIQHEWNKRRQEFHCPVCKEMLGDERDIISGEGVKNKTHQSHCICRGLERYDAWVEKNRPAVEWPEAQFCIVVGTKNDAPCGMCDACTQNSMRAACIAAYERARKGEG